MTFKNNNIPWVEAEMSVNGDIKMPVSAYIDLASSEAIEMLIREDAKFNLSDDLEDYYLGRGFSGDINKLIIGPYVLENVKASFADAKIRSKQNNADGVLGIGSLRRFNLIFDYKNRKLYLKPNSHFNESFN